MAPGRPPVHDAERPEGVAAGTARLVGPKADAIIEHATRLLKDEAAYRAMATDPEFLAGVAFNRSREPVSPGAGRPQAIRKGAETVGVASGHGAWLRRAAPQRGALRCQH